MTDENDRGRRKDPPDSEADWVYIWTGIDKAHRGWPVVGPVVAAVTNWKAWLAIAGIVAFVRGQDIMDFIKSVIEVPK